MPSGVYKHKPHQGFQKGQRPWNYSQIRKLCLYCEREFFVKPSHSKQKYCSQDCFWKAILPIRKIWNKNLTIKDKKVREWHRKGSKTRKKMYASGELIPWNKNKKGCFSKKTRKKMSDSQLLRWSKIDKITEEERINRRKARLGKSHSAKTKEKMKKSRTKYWDKIGRKDWDVRIPTAKDIKWRMKIFSKDNYKCQKCKAIGNLNAHHIFNYKKYPDLRFETANGITLCENCHKLFHHLYGNKNNNKEQLENFLKS